MLKTDFQEFKETLNSVGALSDKPKLILHSCCAPCSSACLEKLVDFFSVTVFYFNPNITPIEEYEKRKKEQIRLINELNLNGKTKIEILDADYVPKQFFEIAKGLEDCPERGERCLKCYELRMRKTAQVGKEKNFDYFATTLTLSPLKNSKDINQIGRKIESEEKIKYLVSDFKKEDGNKRSIELSGKYNLYRQNYCGCVYSKINNQKRREKNEG